MDEYGAPHVVVGPPDLVRRRSLVYAVVVPGREDPSSVAARLRRAFAKVAPPEYRHVVEALTVDEIRAHLPGPSEVREVKRGVGGQEGAGGGGESAKG